MWNFNEIFKKFTFMKPALAQPIADASMPPRPARTYPNMVSTNAWYQINEHTRKIKAPNMIPPYLMYAARSARRAAKLKPPNSANVPSAAAAMTLYDTRQIC